MLEAAVGTWGFIMISPFFYIFNDFHTKIPKIKRISNTTRQSCPKQLHTAETQCISDFTWYVFTDPGTGN